VKLLSNAQSIYWSETCFKLNVIEKHETYISWPTHLYVSLTVFEIFKGKLILKRTGSHQRPKKITRFEYVNRFNIHINQFASAESYPTYQSVKYLVDFIFWIHASVHVRNVLTWILHAWCLRWMIFRASEDILLRIMLDKYIYDHRLLGYNETHFKIKYFLCYFRTCYVQYDAMWWLWMLEEKPLSCFHLWLWHSFSAAFHDNFCTRKPFDLKRCSDFPRASDIF
jgi:hypothetical protein